MVGLFVCIADNGRYSKLKTRLGNDSALGDNKYPCTLTAALVLLRDFKGVSGAKRNKGANINNNSSLHRARAGHWPHDLEGVF